MTKYRFSFQPFGLLLFLTIMLPNIIWFALPAPVDILRNQSVTPAVDMVGSVFQVILIASVCFLSSTSVNKIKLSPLVISVIFSILLYFFGWLLYYNSHTGAPVVLLLTVPPCLAFVLFSVDRKNYIALSSTLVFTVCHIWFALVNFIWR